MKTPLLACLFFCCLASTAGLAEEHVEASGHEALANEVAEVERAFARSMADRDFDAFKALLSEEAVFLGGTTAHRGKLAVADAWADLFQGEDAPFSWEPARVQVLDSGTLALSTGPVYNSEGQRVQTYTSTWRLEADGKWRIIFDKGDRYCPPPEPSS